MPVAVISGLTILIMVFGARLIMLYFEIQSTPPPPIVQTAPAYVNPSFGKIKEPEIPNSTVSSSYTWVLDTLDATPNFPEATSAATVYFVPQQTASFGFLSRIYSMAQAVGIDTESIEHRIDDKTASFDDGRRQLDMDIRSYNFSYTYRVTSEDPIEQNADQNLESSLISQATAFLTKINRYPPDLVQGNKNVIYMRIDTASNQITTLDGPEGANMAEVDFFPQDIDGRPTVTSTYYNSPHFVLLLFTGREMTVARAAVSYHERSADQMGMYPLRTPAQAWEDLQAGKGRVVSSSRQSGEVKVQRVFMAYYQPETYQEYIQPVYVFLGEERFVAYVPAITQEYLLGE